MVALRLCMDRIYPPRKNRPIPVVALTSDPVGHGMTGRIGSTSKVVRSPRLITCSKGIESSAPEQTAPRRAGVSRSRKAISFGMLGRRPWLTECAPAASASSSRVTRSVTVTAGVNLPGLVTVTHSSATRESAEGRFHRSSSSPLRGGGPRAVAKIWGNNRYWSPKAI